MKKAYFLCLHLRVVVLHTTGIWLSAPMWGKAILFFLELSLLSRIVAPSTESQSLLLSTELWVTSLSSEILRFSTSSGLWLSDRRNMPAESLVTRNWGPGSEQLRRSTVEVRRKLGDLTPDAAAKLTPAFILLLIASLTCFTISRFSSSFLQETKRKKSPTELTLLELKINAI